MFPQCGSVPSSHTLLYALDIGFIIASLTISLWNLRFFHLQVITRAIHTTFSYSITNNWLKECSLLKWVHVFKYMHNMFLFLFIFCYADIQWITCCSWSRTYLSWFSGDVSTYNVSRLNDNLSIFLLVKINSSLPHDFQMLHF